MNKMLLLLLPLVFSAGCRSYVWKSSVPDDMRKVSVQTFRNETDVTELGSVATRQILREIQREGTFKIVSRENAAVEVQGVLKKSSLSSITYRRESYARGREYNFEVTAEVSFIDVRTGKILVDNRAYTASTSFFSGYDTVTARRDASGRLAEDLARQIVDDLVNFKWNSQEERK